jgi:hypothetical protein
MGTFLPIFLFLNLALEVAAPLKDGCYLTYPPLFPFHVLNFCQKSIGIFYPPFSAKKPQFFSQTLPASRKKEKNSDGSDFHFY